MYAFCVASGASMSNCLEFGDQGFGLRASDFGVWFEFSVFKFRVSDFGFRASGFGFRVSVFFTSNCSTRLVFGAECLGVCGVQGNLAH